MPGLGRGTGEIAVYLTHDAHCTCQWQIGYRMHRAVISAAGDNGSVAWFFALFFICFLATPSNPAVGQSTQDRPVLLIDIKGAIGFVAAGHLAKALEQATAHGAPAVVVRLDTPGGLLT